MPMASSSSHQVLEVTLISAKDLKRVTLFSKMRVYAVASISGGDPRLPTHRTYADREGGRNPMWHAPLRFTIPRPAANLALHVLLRAERRTFGDCDVGEVIVPVRDLAAAADTGGGEQRHLSYQVRRPVSGRKRGVLHISYRLTDAPPFDVQHHQYAAKRQQHKSGSAAYPPPAHSGRQYVPSSYSGPCPHHHQYGNGQGGAARHDGGAAGMGLGIVSGMMIGDVMADAEVTDGVGC